MASNSMVKPNNDFTHKVYPKMTNLNWTLQDSSPELGRYKVPLKPFQIHDRDHKNYERTRSHQQFTAHYQTFEKTL